MTVDLGHSTRSRPHIRRRLVHIVTEGVQLCTGHPAVRTHQGKPETASCRVCRTVWNREQR